LLHLVRTAAAGGNPALPEIVIRADRRKLARRLWRAAAADGTEFGFDLESPLADGETVLVTDKARYVLRQEPEPLLEIPLDVSGDAAAVIGWTVGNLHFPVEAQSGRLLTPDDPGLRQALDRAGIHYHEMSGVFRPGRFTGTLAGHGHGHSHGHSHES
jgi:urease accessory protein